MARASDSNRRAGAPEKAEDGLTARDICLIIGGDPSEWEVRRRAAAEGWPFRAALVRGRWEPHYIVACLPADVQAALRHAIRQADERVSRTGRVS